MWGASKGAIGFAVSVSLEKYYDTMTSNVAITNFMFIINFFKYNVGQWKEK